MQGTGSRPISALAVILLAISWGSAGAQATLPTLRARSRTIDVVDGGHLRRGYWVADPEVELDVYVARRSRDARRVEFRSDVDSLSLDVQPGASADFVVVLEGGERCPTRISTLRRGARS